MSVIEVTGASFDQLIRIRQNRGAGFLGQLVRPVSGIRAGIPEAAAEQHSDAYSAKSTSMPTRILAGYFSVRSVPTLMVLREKSCCSRSPAP